MGLDPFTLQLILFATSTAYQVSQQNKMKRRQEAEADKRKGFIATISGKAENLPVIYGKSVIGGIETKHAVSANYTANTDNSDKTFSENFANATVTGTKNEFLNVQYALCHDGIEGVQWIKVNDKHYNESSQKFKHIIRTHNIGGTADAIASSNGIPSTNYFTGTANVSATYRLNRDDANYSGVPSLAFLVKGRKVKWVEETAGVYSLSTSYEYSNNPALCLLDYLMNSDFGRGLSVNDVDLESFYHAANVCDTIVATDKFIGGKINGQKEVHTVADIASRPGNLEERTYENELWYTTASNQYWYWNKTTWVETTLDATRPIPLYECNLTLDTGAKVRDNIERIMNTMGLAELTWSSEGKYKLLLEHPTTEAAQDALVDTSHYFTDDDIIRENVSIKWPDASSRMNQCTVSFLNEHEDFKDDSVSWPKTNSTAHTTFLAEDNQQPFQSSLTADGITDPYHALAMAERAVRNSRSMYTISLTVSKKGLNLEPGDFVNISSNLFDIVDEVFRVESLEVNSDFTVNLTCYKFDYQTLAWNVSDNIAYSTQPVFNFVLEPPTGAAYTDGVSDVLGTASGRLTWNAASDAAVQGYFVEVSSDNGSTWRTLGTTRSTSFDVTGLVTGVYDFSIRSVSPSGTYSVRETVENKTIQLTTVGKVAVIYADGADETTNTQSYTLTTQEYVAYYDYTGDTPTLPITTGIDFIKFIGDDGTNGTNGVNGSDGSDGLSTYLVPVFIRSASAPSTPTGGSYNFTTKSTTVPSGWSSSVPAGTNPVYTSTALASISGPLGTDSTLTWSTPTVLATNGTDGIDGYTPVKGVDYFDGVDGNDGSDGDSAYQAQLDAGNSGTTTDFLDSLVGADGADGSDGIPGNDGADGVTTYTWVKYADNGTGTVGFSNSPTGKEYIGFAFNKTTATESNTPSNYTWSLIKGADGIDGYTPVKGVDYFDGIDGTDGSDGDSAYQAWLDAGNSGTTTAFLNSLVGADGADGTDGIAGIDGVDGVTTYTWIKYADNGTGTSGFSNAPSGKDYIGFAFNKTTATESTNPADYTWSLIKGADGTDGTDGTNGTDGADGDDGVRGPGWWRYETGTSASTTGLSNTALNSFFAAATGLTKVAGDRLIVVNTSDVATGYLRNNANTSWVEQAEFIDGNLLVNGTVTADGLAANSVTANKLQVSANDSAIYSVLPTASTAGTVSSGATGMYFNGYHNRIEIWESGILRVLVGDTAFTPSNNP